MDKFAIALTNTAQLNVQNIVFICNHYEVEQRFGDVRKSKLSRQLLPFAFQFCERIRKSLNNAANKMNYS